MKANHVLFSTLKKLVVDTRHANLKQDREKEEKAKKKFIQESFYSNQKLERAIKAKDKRLRDISVTRAERDRKKVSTIRIFNRLRKC